IEVSFNFNCWLAPDSYSLTVGVHSPDGVSFDWLDGVLFFHVLSTMAMEGVANLNATARFRRLGVRVSSVSTEAVNV
ncbi:MAG TPA: Wzt carbohydrate-binding domain-containing protein, partial [Pyrinomonadaceae bacterium]|nr:Wzt carbohydrate-binding domain-containing protein [Pyrinomonadaceae bacterium]